MARHNPYINPIKPKKAKPSRANKQAKKAKQPTAPKERLPKTNKAPTMAATYMGLTGAGLREPRAAMDAANMQYAEDMMGGVMGSSHDVYRRPLI